MTLADKNHYFQMCVMKSLNCIVLDAIHVQDCAGYCATVLTVIAITGASFTSNDCDMSCDFNLILCITHCSGVSLSSNSQDP